MSANGAVRNPSLQEKLAASYKAMTLAWPVQAGIRKKVKVLKANIGMALKHPHLFDDDLQRHKLDKLKSTLDDRTIAVVGNANYLLDTDVGSEIDSNDVVIRFNRGFIISPIAQGKKTSVHCLATNVKLHDLQKITPQAHIIYVSPVRSYLATDLRDPSCPCACIPLSDWKALSVGMGRLRPSAGLIIIDFLLNHTTSSKISLYGFDWKRSKSFYHTQKIRDWHSGEAERELLLKWAEKYPGRIDFGNCPMGST
jgi:hypothetical protein